MNLFGKCERCSAMCSVNGNGDDLNEEMVLDPQGMGETTVCDYQGVCNKCGQKGVMYKLRCREPECRDCFLMYARHKFRAALGSSKILPRDAKILIVFDGSADATVLVDMVYYAMMQSSFKRLHCSACSILCIDEGRLLQPNATLEENREHISAVRELLSQFKGFKSFIMPLGGSNKSVFDLEDVDAYIARDIALEREFAGRITSLRSWTSRQDYLRYCRNEVISIAAMHLDCSFAFLSDISTTIATNLLSAVVLGRGGSAALDVGMSDFRLGVDVQLLRPIRDLNDAEVRLYLRAQDLRPLTMERYGEFEGVGKSLQNLTKAFIGDLQGNYPATVSTVFRTSNKIALRQEQEENALTVCDFCRSPLHCGDSATLLAIELSRLVSEVGSTLNECPSLDAVARENLLSQDARVARFCHACRNIQIDSDNKTIF